MLDYFNVAGLVLFAPSLAFFSNGFFFVKQFAFFALEVSVNLFYHFFSLV